MMKFFLFAFFATTTLCACAREDERVSMPRVYGFNYYHDPRTDLCFARSGDGCYCAQPFAVPCTPAVRRLAYELERMSGFHR